MLKVSKDEGLVFISQDGKELISLSYYDALNLAVCIEDAANDLRSSCEYEVLSERTDA